MLKKICDNCKKDITLAENYEEDNFNVQIFSEGDLSIFYNGDLCNKCKNEIIDKIETILEDYNIKNNNESENYGK